MIEDSASQPERFRVVVDEARIPPGSWVAVDPGALREAGGFSVPDARDLPAAEDDDVHELTAADVAAARLVRSLRKPHEERLGRPLAGSSRGRGIPQRDIIPIGGSSLNPRTPDQPFADEAELANDNVARLSLLVALVLAVIGGFAVSTFQGEERRVIEVVPPENESIRIVMPDHATGNRQQRIPYIDS